MDPRRPDDPTLSAWLDSELDDAERSRVDAWLRDHPDDMARVRLWAADRDALRARLGPQVDEPVPAHLEALVMRGAVPTAPAANASRWRRLAGAATLVVTGGVLGALAVAQWPAARSQLARGPAPTWTQRAAVAHAVYTPEQRHPVEVNVREGDAATQKAQEEHLVKWLTKRLGLPVRLFDLSREGFQLVGGRLLPDGGGAPSAQLMYEDGSGQRVTLYLRKPEEKTDVAFRYAQEGRLGMFYWVEEGYGCAIVSDLPKQRLMAIADSIYKQYEDGHTDAR